ncbi:MAG: porin [Herminiimonas sp.]|nr:porin [Herminiimonas sp.]
MKKSLLALAVLSAVAGAASAQTSVVIFGNIGGSVRHIEDAPTGSTKNSMANASNYQTNSFGFRGVEDLGSGMNAHFVLDTTFVSGTGSQALPTSLFDRQALVGVTTQYGTIDLGRVFGPQFYAAISYDPFDTHYTGVDPITRNSISASQASDNTASSNSRTDNAINYTNKFGDLTVRAEYAFGEQANSANNGSTKAVGAVYQTPTMTLGAAYTKKKLRADYSTPLYGNDAYTPAQAATGAGFKDADYYTAGGSYTFGPLRASVGYAHEDRKTNAADHVERNLWTGLRYNLMPTVQLVGGYFKTNISSNAGSSRKDMFVVSAAYLLSKRTTLFVEMDHANFHGPQLPIDALGQFAPSVPPTASFSQLKNGTMIGMNHNF